MYLSEKYKQMREIIEQQDKYKTQRGLTRISTKYKQLQLRTSDILELMIATCQSLHIYVVQIIEVC